MSKRALVVYGDPSRVGPYEAAVRAAGIEPVLCAAENALSLVRQLPPVVHVHFHDYELLDAKDLIEDVPGVIKAWSRGTVVRSWLLDLLVRALEQDPGLAELEGYVDDSGEGRWTVEEAIENRVPMPVISAALFARLQEEVRAAGQKAIGDYRVDGEQLFHPSAAQPR